MALLLRLELLRFKNALRRLARSPLRLVGGCLVWGLIAFSVGGQLALLLLPIRQDEAAWLTAMLGTNYSRVAASLFGLLLLGTYHVISSGLNGGLLAFSESDVDFLFPAPISRRAVMAFRLARDYLVVLLAAGFFLLMMAPQARLAGAAHLPEALRLAPPALLLYLILVMNLSHLLNLALCYHAPRLPLLSGGVKAAFWLLASGLAFLAWRHSAGEWSVGLIAAVETQAARVLLFPLVTAWEAMLTPFTGPPAGYAVKLAALAALAVGSLAVLLTRRENLYEPSLGASSLRARVRAAMRAGDLQAVRALALERQRRGRTVARLAPFGTGGRTLWWKNLAVSTRSPVQMVWFYLLVAVVLPVGLAAFTRRLGATDLLQRAPLFCLYLAWVTSMTRFGAVQAELRRANLIKPLPLSPWAVVASETVPAALGWSLGLTVTLIVLTQAAPEIDSRLAVAVAVDLPAIMLLNSGLNFSLAAVFPSATDQTHAMIANLGMALAAALLLAPGLVAGVVAFLLTHDGWLAGLAAGAMHGALALLMLWLAVVLFRRYEPTD